MAKRINPNWIKRMSEKIKTNSPIDCTTSYNPAAQWLVAHLSKNGVPYRLYNLGTGVKRITTSEIEKCPCCKRKFKD